MPVDRVLSAGVVPWPAYHPQFMTVRSVALAAAVSLGTVLVFSTVTGWLGRVWWVFDILSSFRVQYAALLVPVIVVLLFAHRWGFAGLGVIALAANLAVIVPLYVSKPAPASGAETIQVVSFNVLRENSHLDEVMEMIRASGADVVFLHEATHRIERAVLDADLPYRMVSAWAPGVGFATIALVSEDATTRILPLTIPGIVVTLPLGDAEIEVLGMHPLSPVSSNRNALRNQQLEAAATWAAEQSMPVVIAGDFNATSWSYGFSLITKNLINSQLGFGVQASWPAGHPLLAVPIDNLVYDSGLTVVDRHLGPALGSDHYPLFVTLARAAGE